MFELWRNLHTAPHYLPMTEDVWKASMDSDVDGDGRQLFTELDTENIGQAMVQYGYSAFGFDENGEISPDIHYPIIRDLAFAMHRIGSANVSNGYQLQWLATRLLWNKASFGPTVTVLACISLLHTYTGCPIAIPRPFR